MTRLLLPGSLRDRVAIGLVALALLGLGLRVVLAVNSPFPWGYIWDPYHPGIVLLHETGRLPESTDCWQCYHPPLFYYAGLPFYWLGRELQDAEALAGNPDLPLPFVAVLSLLCASSIVWYCYRFLRLYRFSSRYVLLGFAITVVFPLLLISSWGIEADILLTALMVAFAYELSRYWMESGEPTRLRVALIGVLAGLAIATKYNGLVALPTALVVIALERASPWRPRLLVRDAALVLGIAVAVGGWKYLDNQRQYGTPLFANGSAQTGFSLNKRLHWDRYEFTSLRIGDVVRMMSDEAPRWRLSSFGVYRNVGTSLHALAWSDMGFFSHTGRHGSIGWSYPDKHVPLWLPESVLLLALLPGALAVVGALANLRRRELWPLLVLSAGTLAVYLQWVLSQLDWALKTKYILFLFPPYLVFLLLGLQWVERRAPRPVAWGVWAALVVLVLLTTAYMFEFARRG